MKRSTTRRRKSSLPRDSNSQPQPASSSRAIDYAQEWSGTIARVFLGFVCLWFGVNELVQPHLWTGYVPLISTTTTFATVLVLMHGGSLFVLGVALLFGIAPRIAALLVGLLLAEIIVDLTVGHGVNDIAVRDLGVLGLALAVFGSARQRLILTT